MVDFEQEAVRDGDELEGEDEEPGSRSNVEIINVSLDLETDDDDNDDPDYYPTKDHQRCTRNVFFVLGP